MIENFLSQADCHILNKGTLNYQDWVTIRIVEVFFTQNPRHDKQC
jgi:hypothetical protein